MSEYLDVVWREMHSKINTSLPLPTDAKIVHALKIERYDLRNLVRDLDIGGNGLSLPMVIFRFYPAEEIDYGMQNEAYTQRMEIYFLDRTENEIYTSVTTGVASATQAVSSTAKMFVGQILFFETVDQFRTISSITNTTTVVLDSTITTTTGEKVSSDLTRDVSVRVQLIKDLFKPGTTFTNFQVMKQGSLDVTDMETVNSAIMEKNIAMMAGAFKLEVLYGDAY